MVNNVPDLYKLTIEGLSTVERMGEKSAKKCLDTLWAFNPIPLDLFLGSLNIPMVASSSIKMLIDAGYNSLDKILSISKDELLNVKGLGPIKSEFLFAGLKKNKDIIDELLKLGVKVKDNNINVSAGKLAGMRICITGSTNIKRKDLEQMIKDNGGECKSSVGKETTHLIIADISSQSSKAVQARKNGTKLLSEEDLLEMIA